MPIFSRFSQYKHQYLKKYWNLGNVKALLSIKITNGLGLIWKDDKKNYQIQASWSRYETYYSFSLFGT